MKLIGIYSGRFQPPHKGHLGVYKQLKQIVGPDTFIATTDKQPTPDSPLNFGEKQQIWVRHGVPSSNVVKVKNTYSPVEITQNFMPDTTTAVFALGSKDIARFGDRKKKDEKTGKMVWLKADGTPQYFQPYKGNENDMEPLSKHGYVLVIDDIRIDGKPISGTNVRDALSSPKFTEDQKKKFFHWAFGWYDPSLYQLLVDRFSEATKASAPEIEKMPSMASMINKPQSAISSQPKQRTISKNVLQNVVAEILGELSISPLLTPQGGSSQTSTMNTSVTQRARSAEQAKIDAVKAKQQAERDLSALDTDLKWKKKSIEKLRKDDLPNKRSEIDQLNKQIAGGFATSISNSTSY